ncbi:sn-glycerol-3-phosphate ABC transporter ATP-binding protein UgpC [Gordonia sp. PKS22-38]|uniref:Sn-glycerol-3-phosphate ABC transporter ATP-binding protein UgpC n=1 Tax=Gordonia prachuapensis TaxID=3115651 RepID=A0ABU7MTA0_9ACTN|nr:sn-glycerol-3-phosphate ABC transporter ATP-binding protein UgpC [Gordonia sp. PKS22-38]
MAPVTFDKATKLFPGTDKAAVDNLELEVEDGEFLVLVGPSGCGKSTSLRMLAGLEDVDYGAIRIGDRDVTTIPPKERDVAMVFQNYALYPHMTVAQNMGFALKMSGHHKRDIQERVAEAAKILDLTEYLDRKPKALSGGQRQRVAMGRAIVREPQVFLMDEPLSNLDAKLRVQTRTQIAQLQRRLGTTTVYVTHDQVEAMTMGDRVAILKAGVLQQCASPKVLYETPANVFVAGFIGSPAMNLLTVEVSGGTAHLGDIEVPVPRAVTDQLTQPQVTIGIRPEAWRVGSGGTPVAVEVVEELGADEYVYGALGRDTHRHPLTVRLTGQPTPSKGDVIHLAPDPEQLHWFSETTGARLGRHPLVPRGGHPIA